MTLFSAFLHRTDSTWSFVYAPKLHVLVGSNRLLPVIPLLTEISPANARLASASLLVRDATQRFTLIKDSENRVLRLPDGPSAVVPAVLRAAVRRQPDPAPEHRHLRRPLQPGQGARPGAETLPGQDPGLQFQEQVSQNTL